MGQLVLLVVAAAWAAVLVPPLLRSRIENRPNSSVSDFRDQLSSLQRAMPTRGVGMRSMARPLAPSPLSRPAAGGRPGAPRAGLRTHGGQPPARQQPVRQQPVRQVERPRAYDAAPRRRGHAERPDRTIAGRDAVKRRRANVLFVLALTAGSTLFLAATTKAQGWLWISCVALVALCGYVYVLGQLRQRDELPAARPVVRDTPDHLADRRSGAQRRQHGSAPARRPAPARRHADHWSHAV